MAEYSGISWTDHTHNEWFGCDPVSPGCKHCYAEALMDKRLHKVKWGPDEPRVLTSEANRRMPHRWNAQHESFFAKHGRRQRVFSASLGDWLDNKVPIEWLVGLVDTIRLTPNLDWMLLTKRIGNWQRRLSEAAAATVGTGALNLWITRWVFARTPPPNVWVGATLVNQLEVDRDLWKLLAVPAPVHFGSFEPLLGAVQLPESATDGVSSRLDWVIVGAESGAEARPARLEWMRDLVDQCRAAGITPHVKQLGAVVLEQGMSEPGQHWPAGTVRMPLSRRSADDAPFAIHLKQIKGGDPTEWPEDLRVREFPR